MNPTSRARWSTVIVLVGLTVGSAGGPAGARSAGPGQNGMVAAPSWSAAARGPSAGRPGGPGAGDPYFPLSGNGGFHVIHYGLRLSYVPASRHLAGTAVLKARARQALSRFDLDLSGLSVQRVLVDGHPAAHRRRGQELIITPQHVLARGQRFTVSVRYRGVPASVTDPDGSLDGWIATSRGVFVGSEPQGAMTWFPANSHPSDKSAFDVTVRVPRGYLAVGNGRLMSERRTARTSTTHWRERRPMAAYLATASIARFRTQRYQVNGLPVFVAVDPREARASRPVLAKLARIITWEQRRFGAYPFGSTGAIVMHARRVGYALETQTRPVFDRAPDTATLVHELAHQWFGDSVSVTRWKDIWLNEGFATYAEWLWSEQTGGATARQRFQQVYARPAGDAVWARPVADPQSGADIFSSPVYDRGAMVLEKLRLRVGYRTFLGILRTWARTHRYGHGTTAQFTALAAARSHQNLGGMFRTWLYTTGKPARA